MGCCNYADSAECIDNYFGCIKRYLNMDEAENPLKSRQERKQILYGKRMQSGNMVVPH